MIVATPLFLFGSQLQNRKHVAFNFQCLLGQQFSHLENVSNFSGQKKKKTSHWTSFPICHFFQEYIISHQDIHFTAFRPTRFTKFRFSERRKFPIPVYGIFALPFEKNWPKESENFNGSANWCHYKRDNEMRRINWIFCVRSNFLNILYFDFSFRSN